MCLGRATTNILFFHGRYSSVDDLNFTWLRALGLGKPVWAYGSAIIFEARFVKRCSCMVVRMSNLWDTKLRGYTRLLVSSLVELVKYVRVHEHELDMH